MSAFREALTAAGSDADILAAVAHGVDPDAEAPTPEALAEWWPECPEAARIEAADRLRELARTCEPEAPGDVIERLCFFVYEGVVVRDGVTAEGPHLFGYWPTDTAGKVLGGGGRWIPNPRMIDNLSRRWLEAEPRPRHPFAPIVRAWIGRPRDVTPDRDRRGIIPGILSTMAHIDGRERLPALDAGTIGGGNAQGFLPGLEPEKTALVPALPLQVWDGAKAGNPGGGVPLSQGLWFEAVTAVPRSERGRRIVRLPLTLRDLVAFAGWKHYRPSRHIPQLRRALLEVDSFWVGWERRDWKLVAPQALPKLGAKLGDVLPVHVFMPDGCERGPLIDRQPLRLYRPSDAPAFRAWARLAYLWNQYGTRKGRRIYATRPEVLRSPEGHPVDVDGAVIVQYGKPAHWSHPRCVRTGKRERNPEADRIPVLTPADLVRLCFDGEEVAPGAYRFRLTEARQTLDNMAAAGRIVIEKRATDRKGRRGWRTLEPFPESPDG